MNFICIPGMKLLFFAADCFKMHLSFTSHERLLQNPNYPTIMNVEVSFQNEVQVLKLSCRLTKCNFVTKKEKSGG